MPYSLIHTHIHTLMAEAAMQGANCSSGAIVGSVSCLKSHWHAAGWPGILTSNLPIPTRSTSWATATRISPRYNPSLKDTEYHFKQFRRIQRDCKTSQDTIKTDSATVSLHSHIKCLQKHISVSCFCNIRESFQTIHASLVWNPGADVVKQAITAESLYRDIIVIMGDVSWIVSWATLWFLINT